MFGDGWVYHPVNFDASLLNLPPRNTGAVFLSASTLDRLIRA